MKFVEPPIRPGNLSEIQGKGIDLLSKSGFRVDYLEICDTRDLSIIDNWDGKSPLVALAAAFLGEVRLIDNLVFTNS